MRLRSCSIPPAFRWLIGLVPVLGAAVGAQAQTAIYLDQDTTYTINTSAAEQRTESVVFTGEGYIWKTGAGSIAWGSGSATFALGHDAQIIVSQGTFVGGSNGNENWTNNQSDLQVDAGAAFNGVEASIRVDALTGAGTITSGYFTGSAYQGLFTFGVDNGSGTFSGVLADGAGAIGQYTKTGSGTQVLTGNNTYLGTTKVEGGTLVLAGTSASTALFLYNGATLELNAAANRDLGYAAAIAGTGTLRKTGAGSLSLGGGGAIFNLGSDSLIDIQAGSFNASNGGDENWTNNQADLNVASGATFYTNEGNIRVDALTGSGTISAGWGNLGGLTFGVGNGSGTFAGVLTNGSTAGYFAKAGTGTQTLTANNTYTGNTVVAAGRLVLSGTTASPSFAISSGAVLELSTAGTLNNTGNTTFSGAGTLRKSGAGTAAWTGGAATFALDSGGLIDVQGGIFTGGSSANEVWTDNKSDLNVAAGASFNGVEAAVRVDALTGAGTIRSGYGANQGSLTFGVDNGSGTFSGVLANGDASSPGRFIKTGTGTQTLTGTNTFTGELTITGGVVQLGNSGTVLADNGAVRLTGGTLQLGTSSETIGTLSGTGGLISLLNLPAGANRALTINQTADGVFAGIINDFSSTNNFSSGALIKNGSGMLTLSGNNLYNGGTTINAGTLRMGSANALGSTGEGTVTIAAGATLDTASFGFDLSRLAGSGTITHSGHNEYRYSVYSSAPVPVYSPLELSVTLAGSASLRVNSGRNSPLILLGNHTYTGGTVLQNEGVLRLGNGETSGSILGEIVGQSGGMLIFNPAGTQTFGNVISGTVGVGLGSGMLILTGANTYTGGTVVGGGTLLLLNPSLLPAASTSAGTLTVESGATAAFRVGGAGEFTLADVNVLLSVTNLSNGFRSGSRVGFDTTNASGGNFTISSVITDAAGGTRELDLVKLGTGTLTLDAINTYTGDTWVREGTLALSAQGRLGSSTAKVTVSAGATFDLGGFNYDISNWEGSGTVRGTNRFTFIKEVPGSSLPDNDYGRYFDLDLTLAGSAGFTKRGEGTTLTLHGANTYTGGTTVQEGTLALAHASGVGTTGTVGVLSGATFDTAGYGFDLARLASNGTVTGSGVFAYGAAGDKTVANRLTGAAALHKTGAGTLTLSGLNSYTGGTTIAGGTLQVGAGGAGGVVAGNIANQGALIFNRSNDLTFAGVISGSGTLGKRGAGKLTLGGANTYAGATSVEAGTLQIGAGGATGSLGSGEVDVAAGAKLAFMRSDNLTSTSVISGDGSVTQAGTGTLTLGGNNTFSGGLAITSGTVSVAANANLGASPGGVTLNGGTLATTASFTANRATTLGADGGTFDVAEFTTLNWDGNISGFGDLVKDGLGLLRLGGSNSYAGLTLVNAGTLQLGSATALSPVTTIEVAAGATFDANGYAQTVGGLAGSGSLDVGTAGLTVNSTGTSTYAGGLTGTGGLVKAGEGALNLTAASTYTGGTTISEGVLYANNLTGSAFGSGSVWVMSGGTLGGAGFIGGPTTVAAGGHVAPGNSPGDLTFTSGLALEGGALLDFQLGTISDRILVTGGVLEGPASLGAITLNLSDSGGFTAGTYTLFDFTGATLGSFDVTDFTFGTTIPGYDFGLVLGANTLNLTANFTPVPEPSTWVLLVLGSGALAAGRCRRFVARRWRRRSEP